VRIYLKSDKMESFDGSAFATVVERCAQFLRSATEWAARVYIPDYMSVFEFMTETDLIEELTAMFEQSTCAEIAHMYATVFQGSRVAVLIAGDIVGLRGDSHVPFVRPLMKAFNQIGKYFIIFLSNFIIFL
jgi:hypothetical protein